MTASPNDIRGDLLACLAYQRASVLAIVGGLAEEAWHVPVVADADGDLPRDQGRPPYHPEMAFTCPRPSAAVLGYYRELLDGKTGLGLR